MTKQIDPTQDATVLATLSLGPLPGDALWTTQASPQAVFEQAEHDATFLVSAGVQGLLLQNTGSAPFLANQPLSPLAMAYWMLLAERVAALTPLPIGFQVKANDATSTLAMASAFLAAGHANTWAYLSPWLGSIASPWGMLQAQAYAASHVLQQLSFNTVFPSIVLGIHPDNTNAFRQHPPQAVKAYCLELNEAYSDKQRDRLLQLAHTIQHTWPAENQSPLWLRCNSWQQAYQQLASYQAMELKIDHLLIDIAIDQQHITHTTKHIETAYSLLQQPTLGSLPLDTLSLAEKAKLAGCPFHHVL